MGTLLRPRLAFRPGFLVLAVLLVVQGLSAATPSHAVSPPIKLAIPMDADSPAAWSDAISGAPSVGMIILNPANGPGDGLKATYARLVDQAHANGIIVLGYVYTQWANGKVSVQQAEAWIDRYYSWYHVDGIMLDEANDSCDPAPLGFYTALYNYVKAEPRPGTVMLNPGKATGECYASVSDVLLTFENDYARYRGGYVGSSWTASFPPSHFFHIVFDVPGVAEMQTVISTAAERGAGWVYVTNLNDSTGNPYSSLPYYFAQELAQVEQLDHFVHDNQTADQTTVPILLLLGLTAAGSAAIVAGARKKGAK